MYEDQVRYEEAGVAQKKRMANSAVGNCHNSQPSVDIVNSSVDVLKTPQNFERIRETYRNAMEELEAVVVPEHSSTISMIFQLGANFRNHHLPQEVEKIYEKCPEGIGKNKKITKDCCLLTLYLFNELGGVYAKQGKLSKAASMYLLALQGYMKAHGNDHPWTITAVVNLGAVYRSQGRLEDAAEMFDWAVSGRNKDHEFIHTRPLNSRQS